MRIAAIVAAARGGVIGRDKRMPWHMPADLKHFKTTTMGKPVIMGRTTYESIGRPLPGRRCIVVSRNRDFTAEGCLVVHDVEEAFNAARPCEEVVVMGGASLYEQVLDRIGRLYLTCIHADVEGDTRFPPYEHLRWREVSRSEHPADSRNPYPYTFLTLDRIHAEGAGAPLAWAWFKTG